MEQAPTPMPELLDVEAAPSWLRQIYDRMVLVSHYRHLADLDPADAATLVVVTDWLLWQRCLREQRHALHFEHLLGTPPAERGPVETMMRRNGGWVYDGTEDVTKFRGVSLGLAYVREIFLFVQACERLWFGLDRLCHRFCPKELVLRDLRGDLDLLEGCHKRALVVDLTQRHQLAFIDQLDEVAPGDPDFPNPPVFTPSTEAKLRGGIRRSYAQAIGFVSALVWRWRARPPKILLLLDVSQILGLCQSFPGKAVAPVINAGASPKSWDFLRQCWGKGILPMALPRGHLGRSDRSSLAAIVARLEQLWQKNPAQDFIEGARRDYVRRRLIANGRFADTARMAVSYERLMRCHGFARVVVGDCDHNHGRIAAELAKNRGIPVDEIFNGIFLTDWRTPSRCGDGRSPAVVDRVLAWGEGARSWLVATETSAEILVTGNPIVDALRPLPRRPGPAKRALLLPPYTVETDPAGLAGRVGHHLAELVRMLQARGFDVRLKVHPGHANAQWYETMLDLFGLDCVVYGTGSVRSHLEWADMVIGPPTTGSMAEALAYGRPYYAYAVRPAVSNFAHLSFLRIFFTAAELEQALAEKWEPDCRQVLRDLCATDGETPASVKIWTALMGGTSA